MRLAMCMPGFPDRGDFEMLESLLVDSVEPEEGEEQIGVDAFGAGPIGHDEPRVNAFEGSFRDDDRYLFDRGFHLTAPFVV